MNTGIIFLIVCMGVFVRGLPVNEKEILSSSCIEMTPEREEEIHTIVNEVNDFIEVLSDKHEDIDFTLVKLKVEKHYDDENDDKETVLKIVINDCKKTETKSSEAKYLDNNSVADDSNLAEKTSCDEKTECSNTKLEVKNHKPDDKKNSESNKESISNMKNETHSKINENTKTVRETKQAESNVKTESGDESSLGKNDGKNESKDKNTRRALENEDIENLIKDLEDLNDKQDLSNIDKGVYIFAPTIDNSKVEINNHCDQLYKNLYNSAIQKLANIETELEKLKQTKSDGGIANFKDFINKFDKNVNNPYLGFGGNVFGNYASIPPVYGNRGLEVLYF